MAGIPRLPAELITIVCRQADFSVLKQLRLTSKVCNEYAEPELYRCVILKVNMRSFRRLWRVSQTLHLSHYVKSLVYDGRLLPWDMRDPMDWGERLFTSYEIWDEHLTGREVEKEILYEIEGNPEKYYENFQRLLKEQKDIHRGETETTMLHNILINLPRLESIELVTGLLLPRKKIYLEPAESYEAALKAGLSETGRQTLIEPSFDEPHWDTHEEQDRDILAWPPASTFHMKRFLALKHSCHTAGRAITSFSAGWIDTDLFAKKIALPPSHEMHTFCSSLTHLSLRFADWKRQTVDDGYAGRVSFVGCAPNLESLDLVGLLVNYEEQDHVQFRDDKMWALSFPKLRRLGLSHYFIHGDDLRTFLRTHASTLKEVLLTDIVLTSGIFVDDDRIIAFAAMDKGLQRHEWAKAFDFMASDMQLKTLHLGGSRWKTENAVPNLRERIIKHVVKGGPSPIAVDNDKVMPLGMREGPPIPSRESLQSSSADERVPYLNFLPEAH